MVEVNQELLIEAAQCLWEAYLENAPNFLNQYRERFGTVELRYALRNVDILKACHEGIEVARSQGFDDCYDWSFCPWFLANCLEIDGMTVRLVEDWRSRCAALPDEEPR